MSASAIIGGVIAFFKAVPILDSWLQQLIALYVTGCQQKTLTMILDAASFAARAKTQDERFQAAQLWRDALSRDRIT
jgi:hypothetical protein